MVKLPDEFCLVASDVQNALDERRIDDAKRIAVEHLRAGYHSQAFLNIVAGMLNVKKEMGKPGRKGRPPQHWADIGFEFQERQAAGEKLTNVYAELAKKWGYHENTIRAAVKYFQEAERKHDAETWPGADWEKPNSK
jgi:hypothetical protein